MNQVCDRVETTARKSAQVSFIRLGIVRVLLALERSANRRRIVPLLLVCFVASAFQKELEGRRAGIGRLL